MPQKRHRLNNGMRDRTMDLQLSWKLNQSFSIKEPKNTDSIWCCIKWVNWTPNFHVNACCVHFEHLIWFWNRKTSSRRLCLYFLWVSILFYSTKTNSVVKQRLMRKLFYLEFSRQLNWNDNREKREWEKRAQPVESRCRRDSIILARILRCVFDSFKS